MTHGHTHSMRGAARSVVALIGVAVMTGLGLEAPRPAQAVSTAQLACEPGYVYSVSATGALTQIAPDGGLSPVGGGWQGKSLNGLAIAPDGTHAYAYERLSPENGRSVLQLRRYDAATGTFANDTHKLDIDFQGSLVAGAVNLETGEYVFGGFQRSSRLGRSEFQFRMFGVTPSLGVDAPVRDIGYFWTGQNSSWIGTRGINGDFAFDANGNLFVVGAKGAATMYTVAADELAGASGGELGVQSSRALKIDLSDVNGIAFDHDGTVFLGTETTVTRYNPSTWTPISSPTSSLTRSTDLASCMSPATLGLKKNLPGRVLATDQFTMSVADAHGNVIASARTAGSADGVQAEQVSPVPAVQGHTYRVAEEAAETSDLANYDATWSCTNAADDTLVAAGAGTEGFVTIPGPTSEGRSAVVECAFTNDPQPTSLTLVKAFENSFGAPANPADWLLWAQPPQADRIGFASGDTLRVPPGSIELGEEPQPGYTLDSLSCTVNDAPRDVDADNRFTLSRGEHAICTFTNRDLPGSVSWSKTDSVTGLALPGSEWLLRGPGGESPVIDNTGDDAPPGPDVDPRPGYFALRDLAWGDYTLEETRAPAGYILADPQRFEFTVAADALEGDLGAVPNELALQFKLEKLAYNRGQASPTPIPGATFAVHDDDGAPGAERSDAVSAEGGGEYTIDGLRPGTYWLVETLAPAGFVPLAAPVRFTVSHDTSSPQGRVSLSEGEHPLVRVSDDGSTLRVYDARSVDLPASGGPGAAVYVLAGSGIVLLAAAMRLAVRRSRARAQLS